MLCVNISEWDYECKQRILCINISECEYDLKVSQSMYTFIIKGSRIMRIMNNNEFGMLAGKKSEALIVTRNNVQERKNKCKGGCTLHFIFVIISIPLLTICVDFLNFFRWYFFLCWQHQQRINDFGKSTQIINKYKKSWWKKSLVWFRLQRDPCNSYTYMKTKIKWWQQSWNIYISAIQNVKLIKCRNFKRE